MRILVTYLSPQGIPAAITPEGIFLTDFFGGEIVDNVTALTPHIKLNVSSGDWPLVVAATAASSTATGMDRPFYQAEYSWDFGDPVYPSTSSTVGMNIAPITYHNPEWVFVDLMKFSKAWVAQGSGAIGLDPSGNVSSMDASTEATTIMFTSSENLNNPGGVYQCYYDGSGVLDWSDGATVVAGTVSAHMEQVTVTANTAVTLNITATDPSDYVRNIRLIHPDYVKGGKWRNQSFHKEFLDSVKQFSPLRFMDWAEVNNASAIDGNGNSIPSDYSASTTIAWSDRVTTNHASQDNQYGVALEYQIELANVLKIDPWFCVPHLATDDYMTEMATLIRDTLDPELKCYIEYSNECWNSGFDQFGYCWDGGADLYPSIAASAATKAASYYYSRQALRLFDAFETVFGGTDRIRRVMCNQRGSTSQARHHLDGYDAATSATVGAYSSVDVYAVNAYFGSRIIQDNGGNESMGSSVSAWTMQDMHDYISGTAIPQTIDSCNNTFAEISATPYNFTKLYAYEGGQHILYNEWSNQGNNPVYPTHLLPLLDDYNRDPLIKVAYIDLLTQFAEFGGGTFCAFNSCMDWSDQGRWGSLEYQQQSRSAAPKYDALMTYAESRTNGMQLMYHGRTGKTMWTNTGQVGPNAAHVYRQPGTYNVSVTMATRDLVGVQTSSVGVSSVVITDTYSSMWFDSIDGNDSNDGLTEGLPKQSWNAVSSQLEHSQEDLRLYLKRGSVWDASAGGARMETAGRRVIPYGTSGIKPYILGESGSYPFWMYSNTSNYDLSNIGFQGIAVNGSASPSIFVLNGDNPATNYFLLEVDCLSSTGNLTTVGADYKDVVSYVNCHLDHGTGNGQGISLRMNQPSGPACEFLTVMGNTFLGGSAHTTAEQNLDHAIYPSGKRYFDLFRWNHFQGPSGIQNFCINYNADNASGLPPNSRDSDFYLTDGNDFTGWRNGIDMGAGGPGSASAHPQWGLHQNHIIQDNAFHDFLQDSGDCFYGLNFQHVVIRDNTFYNLRNAICYQMQSSGVAVGTPATIRVYRNKGAGSLDPGNSDRFFRIYPSIVGTQGALNTQEWTFSENQWYLSSTGGTVFIEMDSDTIEDYSFSDQYWAPNATNYFQDIGGLGINTSAEFITNFGSGNTFVDPSWFDPANGDFTTSGA